ncbi:MAG: thioredoxin family protein [Acetobacteraceae bacterium]|nr:thioredoxin family protein [Acetobacteraceae bacterium]
MALLLTASVACLAASGAGCGCDRRDGAAAAPGLPRLVELGSDQCVPCQMMKPILENLRRDYAGCVIIESIDVYTDPGAAQRYRVRVIPTQVFIDASGREVARHEGYMEQAQIERAFRDLFGIQAGPS